MKQITKNKSFYWILAIFMLLTLIFFIHPFSYQTNIFIIRTAHAQETLPDGGDTIQNKILTEQEQQASDSAKAAVSGGPNYCSGGLIGTLICPLLLAILGLVGLLLSISESIFRWLIDPTTFNLIVNNKNVIYKFWLKTAKFPHPLC